MNELKRRDVIKAVGIVGTAGAAAALGAGPALAAPDTAPPSSALGSGIGPDPRQLWDAEGDPLMAAVLERGDAERVNRVLAEWTTNGQPIPAGLPADVREFIEHARKLPDWLDPDRMRGADSFYQKRSFYLSTIIGFSGGLMMSVIPRESRAVYWSKGGSNMKVRIAKTYKLVYDSIAVGAYGPNGRMIVTAVKTRMTHGAVRHLLPQSPHWRRVATETKPISQADMMVTWHSLATMGMRVMSNWGIRLPEDERSGLLHSWQLHGHMLGIGDAYIPATWDQAEALAQQNLDPIMGPTREGVKLANMLVDLGRDIDGRILSRPVLEAFTRYSLGDKLTDWMELPRQPFWEGLLAATWPLYVGIREGALERNALPPELYHQMDELAKSLELAYLGEFRPVNITIPTTNNPNYR
ncbi:oxygenase MpaB family protein [Nocardiopsis tropica]|uniref:oxygenase MpaB family protein n=1 Tax=Tsukamurella strandjordii TaxID=147577 RepID=UPI0031D00ECD